MTLEFHDDDEHAKNAPVEYWTNVYFPFEKLRTIEKVDITPSSSISIHKVTKTLSETKCYKEPGLHQISPEFSTKVDTILWITHP